MEVEEEKQQQQQQRYTCRARDNEPKRSPSDRYYGFNWFLFHQTLNDIRMRRSEEEKKNAGENKLF